MAHDGAKLVPSWSKSALRRLKWPNGGFQLAHSGPELARGGRTVAAVAAAMPAWRGESLVDTLTRLEAAGLSLNSEAVSLTPGCHDVSSGIDTQIVSLRGVNRYHSFFFLQ